jgi:endogenous inhibitor of DNA gyrase (YacG/DUF329 family)
MKPRCPVCDEPLDSAERRFVPFCSERCKLVDLDRWLTGQYQIPGPPVDPETHGDGESGDSAIRSEEEA